MKTQKMPRLTPGISPALILLASGLLGGCEWVDGSGSGSGSESTELTAVEIQFGDGETSTVAAVDENEALLITTAASEREEVSTTYRWSDQPITEGSAGDAQEMCSVETNFSAELAVETLTEACELEGCQVTFEQRDVLSNDDETLAVSVSMDSASDDAAQFIATMPRVRAPIALTYRLTASDNQGGLAIAAHTFCVNSVNEPPLALDDVFTMRESDVLQPSLTERHLLSNDSDDNDVRNQPLRVLTTPAQRPFAAAAFELFEDGTFRYEFGGSSLTDDVEDRFEYETSDGTFTTRATATVRIVAVNDTPLLSDDFPPLIGIAGVAIDDDFNQNVVDPEGATLTFTVDEESLPPSGEIELSADGMLQGVPDDADIGRYSLGVTVSDGLNSFAFEVALNIIANAPVDARSIPDQEAMVGERFNLAVSTFFTDPESQPIEYELDVDNEEAVDLTINEETGLITGFISESGVFEVNITANDGVSQPTQASFDLIALSDNEVPVFDGPDIETAALLQNQTITPIEVNFSDPDRDNLTYSMLGDLPNGLRLSAQGIITGRPALMGSFLGLRVLAVDEEGLSARSNLFSLFVR